jgi:hypothetical protein
MQLIPRYLVNERIILVSNEAGFVVEYRPVYTRNLKVYRNIDNTIQFKLLNADQKSVSLAGYSVWFVLFDENQTMVLEKECTVTDDYSTASPLKGTFQVTITDSELRDVKQQYLHYNVYLKDINDAVSLTYSNRNFETAGIMYINSGAYPGPKSTTEVANFFVESDYWVGSSDNEDAISLNEYSTLHTAAVYSNGYVGSVVVQATLDNQLSNINTWTDVDTITLDGSETEPVPTNFNGIYSYVRFKFDVDPNNTVNKILFRN